MSTSRPMSDTPSDSHTTETAAMPLPYLPDDVRQEELYPRSPLEVLGLFAQTSQQDEKETAFLRLLHGTIDAEPESYSLKSYKWADETRLAAIAILKRHPKLLFKISKVKDHYDRKIQASPYQLFLGAGDIWALKQVHEAILPKIENGVILAQAQFKAQFPNCPQAFDPNMPEELLYDERNKTQIAQVIEQLKIIVEKIKADPCTNGLARCEETFKAVSNLSQIFAPKEGNIIKTGFHFPLGIINEIGRVYDAQFNSWSSAQLSFFSFAVIGGALAALTAVDGQCVKHGLANLNMKKGPNRRDGLFCHHPKGIPQNLAPLRDKLTRTVFVDPYNGRVCFLSSRAGYFDWYNKKDTPSLANHGGGWIGRDMCWKTYSEQKQRQMGAIMQSRKQKSKHRFNGHNRSMRCEML